MTDADKQQRYERIKAIADELIRREAHYSRADLAYELEEDGVHGDSFAVGRLVWEAYKALGDDPSIKQAFFDNSGHQSIIDEFKVSELTEKDDLKGAVALVEGLLTEGKKAIGSVALCVEEASKVPTVSKKKFFLPTKKVVDLVVGVSGVKAVQTEAADIFRRYAALVESYRGAKQSIKDASISFSDLRDHILSAYREWVALLQDLFGDQVRSVAPDVFDFDTIEWLDVDGMFAEAKLAFDTLSGRSAELFSSISSSFQSALAEGLRAKSRFANSRVGLAIAAVGMVSHYSKSIRDTAKLKQQLLDLKDDVTRDVTNIKADMSRLSELYSTINDLYLPQADLFYQYGDKVFDSEWERLVAALYSTPELRSLMEERSTLHKRLKELDATMLDARVNITYYRDQSSATEEMLESLQESYTAALESKPKAPSWMSKAVTGGISREAYVRKLADWDRGDGDIVRRYEDLRIDLKLFEDERSALERVLQTSSEEYKEVAQEVSAITAQIHERQSLSPELLADAAAHLSPVLKLLSIARGIIESRPDERLVTVQTVGEVEAVKLPTFVTDGIERLRKEVQGYAGDAQALASDQAQSLLGSARSAKSRPTSTDGSMMSALSSKLLGEADEEGAKPVRAGDLLATKTSEAAQLSAEAIDALILLKQRQIESKMTEAAYN